MTQRKDDRSSKKLAGVLFATMRRQLKSSALGVAPRTDVPSKKRRKDAKLRSLIKGKRLTKPARKSAAKKR